MLASTASAPRVRRCSLGLYWSHDLCTAGWLAGWGLLSYLGQIVRGSEIWWFMTSAHSLSTSLRLDPQPQTQGEQGNNMHRWVLLFWFFFLALSMLRLLSSMVEKCKKFCKPSNPCHVGIHWKALTKNWHEYPYAMVIFQLFASFPIDQINH